MARRIALEEVATLLSRAQPRACSCSWLHSPAGTPPRHCHRLLGTHRQDTAPACCLDTAQAAHKAGRPTPPFDVCGGRREPVRGASCEPGAGHAHVGVRPARLPGQVGGRGGRRLGAPAACRLGAAPPPSHTIRACVHLRTIAGCCPGCAYLGLSPAAPPSLPSLGCRPHRPWPGRCARSTWRRTWCGTLTAAWSTRRPSA